jgi:hypothetical protein
LLKAGERPVENLACQAKLAGDVLKLATQIDRLAIRSGFEIEVEHDALFGRTNFHNLKTVPELYDLMRNE